MSATNGKTTTAAMAASILRRDGVAARAQPGGREHGRRDRLDAAVGRARARADRGRARPVRGRRAVARPVAAQLRGLRAVLLSNLFRDQLDRYGELETIADSWDLRAARGTGPDGSARAERRRSADRRPRRETRAGEATGSCISASMTTRSRCAGMAHAADAKHCRRCGAPYTFDAVYLGPSRPLPLPELRPAAARRHGARERGQARGRARRAASGCARRRARPRSSSACPGSTTSTTRSGPPRWRARCGIRLATSSPGCRPPRRPSGGRRP